MQTNTKKKPKRIRFSGYSKEESEEIHDRAEQIARAVMMPVKKKEVSKTGG